MNEEKKLMTNTRTTNYEEMEEIKKLIPNLELRRQQEWEADELRRLKEKEADDLRRQQEELRRQKEKEAEELGRQKEKEADDLLNETTKFPLSSSA